MYASPITEHPTIRVCTTICVYRQYVNLQKLVDELGPFARISLTNTSNIISVVQEAYNVSV